VWKVTNPDGGKLYLGGSVHALRKSDHPLPTAFDRALADSSRLIFEVDDTGMGVEKIVKSGEYPRGDSLKNHVDPRTYDYLKRLFGLLGVPEAKFSKYRPWLLTLMLWSPNVQGLSSDLGVEGHLKKRARSSKKPIAGLVTTEQHLNVFSGLTERQSEAVLLMTFIPTANTSHSSMIGAWRKGEVEALWRSSKVAFSEYPAFGERLLEVRNRAWMPKIEGYMRSGEPHFVVVGAAHLGGPGGLLNLLKERGCQLEQL
jgi:uncharacterized protein YbaP (TraB family)